MKNVWKKEMVKIAMILLIPLMVSGMGLNKAMAAQDVKDPTTYTTKNGEKLTVKKADDFMEVNQGGFLDMTEFEVKKEYKSKINTALLNLESLVRKVKDCNKELCLQTYQESFYKTQKELAQFGVVIYVHSDPENLKNWNPAKHFWAYTQKEGYISDNGKVYKRAIRNSEAFANTKEGKEYYKVDCTINKDCLEKVRKQVDQRNSDVYSAAKKVAEAKEKLAEEQKDLEDKNKELMNKERTYQMLNDATPGNDKEALKQYCASASADASVCNKYKANDITGAKAILKSQIEIDKTEIKEQEKAVQKASENLSTAAEKASNASNLANEVGEYQTPTGTSNNLPPVNTYIVAYEGLFTQPKLETAACQDGEKISEINNGMGKGNTVGEPTEGKIAKIFVDIIRGVVDPVVDLLFGMDCPGVSNGNFSLVTEILNIASPLNLTQNFIIMKLVSITQSLAYVFAFALIVFYGIMYTTGYENLEPVKFGIRMFFALILVYYLPYLMQDILNINNVIVYNLSQIKVYFDGVPQASSFVFAGALKHFMESIVSSLLTNLLTLIIAIAMIYFAIQPIVKIMIWWYTRMLKIFFYAIIGPIMVVMMALPQTSKMASKWVKDFIGETFSQVFMVLAMAMLAFIVGNIGDFALLTNLGWLGTLLVIYAAILFLAETPSIASEFLGSIGGLSSKQLAKDVMSKSKEAKRATGNMLTSGANAAKNMAASATNGQRGSMMKSLKESKGMTGKIGALAGGLAGKGYTTRLSNKSSLLNANRGSSSPGGGTSLKDIVDSKVKPKVQNWQANKDNTKAQKSEQYQERSNEIMGNQQAKEKARDQKRIVEEMKKEHGEHVDMSNIQGMSLNEQTATAEQDTERRKKMVEQMKNDGTVQDYKNLHDIKAGNHQSKDNKSFGETTGSVMPNFKKEGTDKEYLSLSDIPSRTENPTLQKGSASTDKSEAFTNFKEKQQNKNQSINVPGEGKKNVGSDTHSIGKATMKQEKKGTDSSGKVKGDAATSPTVSPKMTTGEAESINIHTPGVEFINSSDSTKSNGNASRSHTEREVVDAVFEEIPNETRSTVSSTNDSRVELDENSNAAPIRERGNKLDEVFGEEAPKSERNVDRTREKQYEETNHHHNEDTDYEFGENEIVERGYSGEVSDSHQRKSENVAREKNYYQALEQYKGQTNVDASRLARKLGISPNEAQKIVLRLERENHINRND